MKKKIIKENLAEEKLRVIDIIRDNAALTLTVAGFVWVIYSMVILPIKTLEFQVGNILNNHIKTIQDEQVTASAERKAQSLILQQINESIIRLQEQLKER